MTDASQYADNSSPGSALGDTAAGGMAILKARIRGFLAKEENRKELRRLLVIFLVQYTLLAVFVVTVLRFVATNMSVQ